MFKQWILPASLCAALFVCQPAVTEAGIIDVTGADLISSRSYPGGGLDVYIPSGSWDEGLLLEWEIAFDSDTGLWDYQYWFTVEGGSPSHLLLQISDGRTASDFNILSDGLQLDGGANTFSPSDPGNSNPGLPYELYGLKFDSQQDGDTDYIHFTTTLSPIWGSFYAKDGNAGCPTGQPTTPPCVNAAWNYALSLGRNRPTDATDNFNYFVAVPDGFFNPDEPLNPVPEPATLAMFGIGLAGVALLVRRRKAKSSV